MDERYAAQRDQVDQAREAALTAEAKLADARARVANARDDLEAARLVVAEYVAEAYMRPPAADTLRVLSLADADDAGFAHTVMELMTENRQQVVEALVAQQAVVDREEAAAEVAAGEARRRCERCRGAAGGAGQDPGPAAEAGGTARRATR
ncbi:MAG: hypothetical protein V9E94_07340 [Microthrixaceae bacterium]